MICFSVTPIKIQVHFVSFWSYYRFISIFHQWYDLKLIFLDQIHLDVSVFLYIHYMAKRKVDTWRWHLYMLVEHPIPKSLKNDAPPTPLSSGKAFHGTFAVRLWGYVLIHLQEHLQGQSLMFSEEAWAAVRFPIHPKHVHWGLRSGLCTDHSSSSTPTLENIVMLEQV